MTVKDILKTAATMLGREDITAYLEGDNSVVGEDTLPAIGTMTNLLNLVIGELSGTFIPMAKREKPTVKDGRVYYADLSERCVRIIAVYNSVGEKVEYAHTPEYMGLSIKEPTVEYEYIPPNYGLEDAVGFTEEQVSVGTLAYGLCAEFAISKGSFDEAVMWHDRYVNSVYDRRKLKNVTVKKRSFV